MKKIIVCIITLCINIVSIQAQSNYEQGYVITNNQDTILGLIDYRTDFMNGKICKFKTDSLSKEQIYYPDDIIGFRYNNSGKFYITKTINIDNIPRTVFLEYLVKGIMNLYFYRDADFNMLGYYIFEDENGTLYNIFKQADKYLTKESGAEILKKDAQYRTDLNFVFGDIEQIASKLPNANFDHKTMISFTKNYHKLKCRTGEDCIEFETKIAKKNVICKFSFYGGYEWFSYSYINYENNFVEKKVADAFIIGGRVEFISPRWNKSIGALLDFSYSKNTCVEFKTYSVSKFEIDFGGKYTYHKGGLRPTAEAGMSLLIEKHPYNFSYALCLFLGFGIDLDTGNNKFITILANYVTNPPSNTNIWRLKFGFKF